MLPAVEPLGAVVGGAFMRSRDLRWEKMHHKLEVSWESRDRLPVQIKPFKLESCVGQRWLLTLVLLVLHSIQ